MSKAFYFILALAIAGGSLAITNPFDLPIVFAQVSNNDLIITSNSTWTNTYDPITNQGTLEIVPPRIMVDGNWERYALEIQSDKIIYRTEDKGGMIYDIPTCSYSIYDYGYDGEVIIPSVSVLAIEKINDEWQHMAVNEESCNVEVIEDLENNEIQIISIKENTDEKFETDIILNDNGIKETWKVTSNSQNQLGITQTAHVGSEIRIDEQVIDIAQYNGQSFDRQFLEDNQVRIFEIADKIGYEFQDAFDSLRNINIIQDGETYKVNLDYSDGNFVNYLEIDPTFTSPQTNNIYAIITSGGASSSCGTAVSKTLGVYRYSYLRPTSASNADSCYITGYQVDTSSIPDSSIITNVELTFDTQTIPGWGNLSGKECAVYDVTTDLSGTLSSAMLTDIMTGTNYIGSGNTSCHSGVTTYDLGTQADTDLQNNLSNNFFAMGLGWTDFTRNSNNVGTADVINLSLSVTYTVPPPDDPTGLSVTQDTVGELDLSWSQTGTVTGFKIERSLDNSSWTTLTSNTGTTATTYTDTGLNTNTLYYYRVFAYNSGTSLYSTGSTSNSQTTWDYPEQVTGLIATTGDPISLSWSVPASDDTIINYKVYRDTVFLKTVVGTSTTDTPPSFGSSYSYTVSAVSSVGEGAQSASSSANYGIPPNPPTSVTTSITNVNTNPLDIFIQYSSPTYVGSGTLTGFEIVRDGSVVATVGLVTSYTDTVPSAGTYTYLVRAISTHGTSSDSNTSNITTPTTADPPALSLAINNPNPNPFDITVSITPPANNGGSAVTGYNIYSSPDDNTYTLESSNVTTAQTITVSGQGTWYFKAESINPVGTGSLSTAYNITTPTEPSAISDLSATANSDTAITLSWSSPNNGGSSITLYKVFQDAVQIDTTTNTSYTVTGLSPNTSYDFTVVASNNVGDSTISNTATQTTYLEITGHIDLTATTQGSTTQFIFSANVTAGTPTPTFSTFDILKNGVTVASNISSPYNLKLTDTASNTYTIISTDNTHWNTPSINGTVSGITASYQADWQTDLLGTNEVAFNLSRANDQLNLVVNRDTGTSTWHLNCNYRTNTQILAGNNGTWYEVNSWYYDDTQNINDASIVYIDCYNDDVILQITSYSSDRTGGGIAVLNGFFEDWTGTPVALFFVLLVAGLFSGRTAPTGILLILAIVGVMAFVGLLVIDEAIWAFVLLVGILGLFVGKRFL